MYSLGLCPLDTTLRVQTPYILEAYGLIITYMYMYRRYMYVIGLSAVVFGINSASNAGRKKYEAKCYLHSCLHYQLTNYLRPAP